MKIEDFVFINVPGGQKRKEWPVDTGRVRRSLLAGDTAQVRFFRESGLMLKSSLAFTSRIEETVVWMHDLTEEGQDFVMSQALGRWLDSCDRKASELFKKGAPEETILEMRRDPDGLFKRLEKFRMQRKMKSQ